MRSLYFFAVVFLLLEISSGCGSRSGDLKALPKTRLRVVHTSPNAPNVDVLVDNSRVLANVPYKTGSGYLSPVAGTRNIKVNAAGTSTSVINANVNLDASKDYTVLAVGNLAQIEPLVLNDNNGSPATGQIKLRLVHAASGVGKVDIYITAPAANLAAATPTLAGVPFKAASDYLTVPAGTYRVRITPEGAKTVAIDSGSLTLSAGQIRTAVAVGNPTVGKPLDAIVLADN